MSHKSRKRNAKESGLENERSSKKRKRSKDSRSSSPKRSKSKHKKDEKVESEWINHPKIKCKCIDESDYYRKYAEFQQWALNECGKYLDEMSTKKCTKLFKKKFVKKWNEGKLDKKYYETFSFLSVDNKQKTRFKWNFEKNISSKEQMTLDLARDTVDNETNDNAICDRVAQRFQQRFEQRRKRQKKRENYQNGDKEKEFDKKQWREQKKQKRNAKKQEIDGQMLQSYQSFISSPTKKRRK